MTTHSQVQLTTTPLAAQKRDWPRVLMLILIVAGLLVAGYMSLTELTGGAIVCPGGTEGVVAGPGNISVDCASVNSSAYAKVLGIPVALIGVAGYLALGAVLLLEDRISLFREYGHLMVFGMALFGFLFIAYLTYIEFFVIYMVCTWCLTNAVLMTAVFILSTARLVQSLRAPAD